MFNHANRSMDLVDVKIEPQDTKPIVVVYCNPVKTEKDPEKEDAKNILSNPVHVEKSPTLEPKQEMEYFEELECDSWQPIPHQSVSHATLKQAKRPKLDCTLCNYQSTSMSYMQKHLKLVHKNDGDGFTVPASDSKRSFQCDCGYSTIDQSNFRKHSNRYPFHISVRNSRSNQSNAKKIYQCDCGYNTNDNSNFIKHSKRFPLHRSNKTYQSQKL